MSTEIRVRLINRSRVREFALQTAKSRAHKFTRVGSEFLLKCEGQLRAFICSQIARLPSKGKTIK